MGLTRVWLGRVRPGREAEHEAFVAWLRSPEAAGWFGRYLDGYTLRQADGELEVVLRADEPLDFIRFLRLPKLWPSFWEYVGAGPPGALGPNAEVRVAWERPAGEPRPAAAGDEP